MSTQNFKNHSQYVPVFHFVLIPLVILCFAGSIWNLKNALHVGHGRLPATLLFLLSDVMLAFLFIARGFALKAQDRAIRAEENLRHFALSGKLHDPRLKTAQIIALRFAPDEEFLSLSARAAKENLKGSDIKKEIKNWKADHYRV